MSEPIDKILGAFDFERVHKVMRALNWTWSASTRRGVLTSDMPTFIPTMDELRSEAKMFLTEVAKSTTDTYIWSGGLRAVRRGEKLILEFVITSEAQELS